MNEQDFEVVIVGAGAAGLSAALVLGRARRRVAVIDAGQQRNAAAANMHGFLSRDGMPPAELLAAGRAEVTGNGVQLVDDRVLDVGPASLSRSPADPDRPPSHAGQCGDLREAAAELLGTGDEREAWTGEHNEMCRRGIITVIAASGRRVGSGRFAAIEGPLRRRHAEGRHHP